MKAFRLKQWRMLVSGCWVLIQVATANAATINFNGTPVLGCSLSGLNYTCAPSSTTYSDSIIIADNYIVTVTGSGNIFADKATLGLTSGINGNLTTGTTAALSANAYVTGGLTAGTTAALGANAYVTGGLTAGTTAALGTNAYVTGGLTAGTTAALDSGAYVCHDLQAKTTAALGANAYVTGGLTAGTTAALGANAYVNGNLQAQTATLGANACYGSVSANTVTLGAGAGVCPLPRPITPCSPSPSSNSAGSFECLETGTNSPWNASARKPLYTKLANINFTFDIAALKMDGTLQTNYVVNGGTTKTVIVELVDGSGTTACASRTVVSPAVSQSLKFSAADGGRKSTASIMVNKAYANLRCRVTDASQSPSVVACSTDSFSVRPQMFSVSSSNANADFYGASTVASPVIKAGTAFSLSADTATIGYNGTPLLNTSSITAHSGAIANGVLSGAFGAAVAGTGIASGSGFAYSEIGYFSLGVNSLTDDSFTAIDQPNDCTNDFSNTLIDGKYGCKFGNISVTSYFGRFVPDHFTTTLAQACAAGGFTYSGQPFTIWTTALTSGGSTTLNYSGGSWAKSVTLSETATISGTLTNGTVVASEFLSGIAKHSTTKHSFATQKTVPATTFLRATDSDLVSSSGFSEGALVLRSGRLQLGSAYGTELLRLVMPLVSQYWKEGGNATITTDDFWTTNTADSCTLISNAGITLGNYHGNLVSGKTIVTTSGNFALGEGDLSLSAPGANNNGSVDVTINNATAGVPWFGDVNEVARGTFGLRKTPIIYIRENF